MRGGALLLVSTLGSIGATYIFLLASGRLLGPEEYSTLAALLGVLTVVLLPTGALQMAVSREVSRSVSRGDDGGASAFVRAILALGAKATVPLLAAAFVLLVPLKQVLKIGSTGAVALALVALSGAFLAPIALGALQGYQRFRALALLSFAPFGARLAFLLLFAIAGLRLHATLAAISLSAVLGAALAVVAIRGPLRAGSRLAAPPLGEFLHYLAPVVVGVLGVGLLTNGDILVVKARFSPHEAGLYAAASAFARVAFFLPAVIPLVLFPRTAARQARGEEAGDILGRSLIVTFGFCALLATFYALVGDQIVRMTYGAEFADAGSLLALFSIAMGCFSLTNVLVSYHLSRGETRFAWVVAGGVAAQIVALATLPTTLREAVWINIAVGIGLLLAHEVTVESSLPALRSGFPLLREQLGARHPLEVIRGARQTIVEAAAVLVGAAAFVVLLTWPLAVNLNSRLLGQFPNDAAGTVSWLWRLHHEQGYHLLGITHHVQTGAPFGWDQGNALNLQWLLPYFPAYVASPAIGEIAAFNVVVLAGLVLSGAAMYLLVRWLGCGRLVAAWASLVFMLFPWHLDRAMAGHGSLVHIEVFPIFALAVLAWARRPDGLRLALVALSTLVVWLTSGLFGFIALVALLGLLPAAAWHQRQTFGSRGTVARAAAVSATILVTAGLVGGLALAGRGQGGLGSSQMSIHLLWYGAHPSSFVRRELGGTPGQETRLFVGWLTVALAIAWLVVAARFWSRRSRRLRLATVSLTALVIAGVAFSLSNPLLIGGHSVHPMPSYFLWKLAPQFRVPARFVALVMTGLVPLAALGLRSLCTAGRRLMPSPVAGKSLAAALCVGAGLISFAELRIPLQTTPFHNVPPEYRALAATPGGVLAEYPLVASGDFGISGYLFWQRIHHRRLLNGAEKGTSADDVRRALVDPGAPGTARALALLGVTTIITRPNTYDFGLRVRLKRPAPSNWGPGYRLVERFEDGTSLWRVTARPAPAIAAYRSAAFGGPEPSSTGRASFELHRDGRIDIYAKAPGVWRLRFYASAPNGLRRMLVVGRRGSRAYHVTPRTVVSIPVAVPRGHSTLMVRAPMRPAGLGAPSLSSAWFAPASTGDRAQALRPVLVSDVPGF